VLGVVEGKGNSSVAPKVTWLAAWHAPTLLSHR
jgi:hypothetical protein